MFRRFLRRNGSLPRYTHLSVIVLPDEISAFQAYRLLNYHGISPEHVAIVGTGYSSPERIGLLRPAQIAARQAVRFGLVAGSAGLLVGGCISFLGQHLSFPLGLSLPVSSIPLLLLGSFAISVFFGAILGCLVGMFGEGTAASLYRHHLNRGHYLLMVEGSEQLVKWGQEVLSHYSMSRLY
ncbi:MAG: hypothetical protein VKJ24_17135 [Synechococcales bacterium]|nr:hypothetical protein [Synechococcales bacterium]